VVASGFLNPANNSNGPAFGLYAALPSGGELLALPVTTTTSIKEVTKERISIYPNPVKDNFTINFNGVKVNQVSVIDIMGRNISTIVAPNSQATINMDGLPSGTYFVQIRTNDKIIVEKVNVIR
jgi:hypothetical protein